MWIPPVVTHYVMYRVAQLQHISNSFQIAHCLQYWSQVIMQRETIVSRLFILTLLIHGQNGSFDTIQMYLCMSYLRWTQLIIFYVISCTKINKVLVQYLTLSLPEQFSYFCQTQMKPDYIIFIYFMNVDTWHIVKNPPITLQSLVPSCNFALKHNIL